MSKLLLLKYLPVPQSPTKGRDRSLELRQCEDPTLAPYFTYLEGGVLPDDETAAWELALTKRLWMMFYIVWKRINTLSHSPTVELEGAI